MASEYRQDCPADPYGRISAGGAQVGGGPEPTDGAEPRDGNTGTPSSHGPPPALLSGGIDTLDVIVHGKRIEKGDSESLAFADVEKRLEAGRAAAISGGDGRRVAVHGATLVMRPSGFQFGNAFFAYVGDYDGITVALTKSTAAASCPVAKVSISSLKLMRDGGHAAWAQAKAILFELGIEPEICKVFRVDFCSDLAGVSSEPVVEAVGREEVVKRLRSQKSVGVYLRGDNGRPVSCVLGDRRGCRISIYDKVYELEQNPNRLESEAKRHVLVHRRWGYLPLTALRVEFQCRGTWLRSKFVGLESVEQILDRACEIVAYLTREFFRVVDGPVDRANKNQQRAALAPVWEQVIDAFLKWAGQAVERLKRVPKALPSYQGKIKCLVRQMYSLAALAPSCVNGRRSLFQTVYEQVLSSGQLGADGDIAQRMAKQVELMEASGAFSVLDTWGGALLGRTTERVEIVDDVYGYIEGRRAAGPDVEVPF